MLISLPASHQKFGVSQSASVPGSSTVARPDSDSVQPAGGDWLGECVVPQRATLGEEANSIQTVGSKTAPTRPQLGWR